MNSSLNLFFAVYLLAVNLMGFCAMGMDKRKAVRGKWRIPEARLFLLASIGGSPGSLAGMYVFHHKTRHRKFVIGMPLIFGAQIILALILLTWFKRI